MWMLGGRACERLWRHTKMPSTGPPYRNPFEKRGWFFEAQSLKELLWMLR